MNLSTKRTQTIQEKALICLSFTDEIAVIGLDISSSTIKNVYYLFS